MGSAYSRCSRYVPGLHSKECEDEKDCKEEEEEDLEKCAKLGRFGSFEHLNERAELDPFRMRLDLRGVRRKLFNRTRELDRLVRRRYIGDLCVRIRNRGLLEAVTTHSVGLDVIEEGFALASDRRSGAVKVTVEI